MRATVAKATPEALARSSSAKQVQALRRKLDHRHVRTREAHGRELYYIEGWYAVTEANRISGFDGWNRETIESRCVHVRENRGTFLAIYIAKVRISVHANGTIIIREGHGTGEGRGTSRARSTTSQGRGNRRNQTRTSNVRKTVWPSTLWEWENRIFSKSPCPCTKIE
jgi:recombination DNA repair RAD52 pathway protein